MVLVKSARMPSQPFNERTCPAFWNAVTHRGQGFPDYCINANWMLRRFIQTQCPTPDTVDDFLGMIVTNGVRWVVAICNPVREHEAFMWWLEKHYYDRPYRVETRFVEQDMMQMTLYDRQHLEPLHQFHVLLFSRWEDCSQRMPDRTELLKLAARLPDDDGPVVVHCLMGINRSGCFVLLHWLLSQPRTWSTRDELWQLLQRTINEVRWGARPSFLWYEPYQRLLLDVLMPNQPAADAEPIQ